MKKFISIIGTSCLFLASMAQGVEYEGSMSYENSQSLTSPITGVINKVPLSGKYYKKGSLLVGFDKTIINNNITLIHHKIKLNQLTFDEQSKDFDRASELYDANTLSDHDLKLAEIALLKAKLNLQESKNELQSLKWDKQFYQLKAPTDGVVVKSFSYVGKYLVNKLEAKPVLNFINSNNIIVKISINKSEYNQLSLVDSIKKESKEVMLSHGNNNYKAKLLSMTESGESIFLKLKLEVAKQLPSNGSWISVNFK